MIKASEALSQLTSKIDQIKDDSIRRKLMERIKQAESIPDDQWEEVIDGVGKWLSFTIKNGEKSHNTTQISIDISDGKASNIDVLQQGATETYDKIRMLHSALIGAVTPEEMDAGVDNTPTKAEKKAIVAELESLLQTKATGLTSNAKAQSAIKKAEAFLQDTANISHHITHIRVDFSNTSDFSGANFYEESTVSHYENDVPFDAANFSEKSGTTLVTRSDSTSSLIDENGNTTSVDHVQDNQMGERSISTKTETTLTLGEDGNITKDVTVTKTSKFTDPEVVQKPTTMGKMPNIPGIEQLTSAHAEFCNTPKQPSAGKEQEGRQRTAQRVADSALQM